MFWKDKIDVDFSGPRECHDDKYIQNLALVHEGINYKKSNIAGLINGITIKIY
jgi:hypothetical protein